MTPWWRHPRKDLKSQCFAYSMVLDLLLVLDIFNRMYYWLMIGIDSMFTLTQEYAQILVTWSIYDVMSHVTKILGAQKKEI